jgi:hypothetical protein
MRLLRLALIVSCLVALVVALAVLTASPAGVRSVTLAIADQGANETGLRTVLLQITNHGPYRICYPDGFHLLAKGAARPVYIPTTNLWLRPGEGANLSVPLPGITADWRGAVSYYVESPWNRIKMRLGSSALGRRLPSVVTTVQGAEVLSPWFSM